MAARKDAPSARNNVPDIIKDLKTGKSYKKGKFLGKVSKINYYYLPHVPCVFTSHLPKNLVQLVVVVLFPMVDFRYENSAIVCSNVQILCWLFPCYY